MPSVKIPEPYRGVTQGQSEVEVEGGSVKACLEAVEAVYPGFLELIFAPDGAFHRYSKIFCGEDLVRLEDLEAEIPAGTEIQVMSPVAGG